MLSSTFKRIKTNVQNFVMPSKNSKLPTCELDKKRYSLYSLANNSMFYKTVNKFHLTGLFEYDGSLSSIIDKTFSGQKDKQTQRQSDIKLIEKLGEGNYNMVYSTNQDQIVFRMIKKTNASNSQNKQYLTAVESDKSLQPPTLNIDRKTITIDYISLIELYGLIIQYYFTGRCENICKVYDFGIMAYGGTYIAYAILEGVNMDMKTLFYGGTSAKLFGIREKLTLDSFKKLWIDLLESLKCIHIEGFVHLDVKPENVGIILKGNTIRPVLIDFGFTTPIDSNICKQFMIGSLQYIPPGCEEKPCRIQSDIYAYAVMLFEILIYDDEYEERDLQQIMEKSEAASEDEFNREFIKKTKEYRYEKITEKWELVLKPVFEDDYKVNPLYTTLLSSLTPENKVKDKSALRSGITALTRIEEEKVDFTNLETWFKADHDKLPMPIKIISTVIPQGGNKRFVDKNKQLRKNKNKKTHKNKKTKIQKQSRKQKNKKYI